MSKFFSVHPYQSAEWWRDYRFANLDKLRAYKRRYDATRYETHSKQEVTRRKRWHAKNPNKIKAHQVVHHAIQCGKLVRGVCEVCKSSQVVAHHDDYTRPLAVRWLCQVHHMKLHRGSELSHAGTQTKCRQSMVGATQPTPE